MSHSRKRIMQTMKRKARQRVKTEKQQAQDHRYWACGRKVLYSTEGEAREVADRLGHTVYSCQYGDHFHTAHTPGSARFNSRRSVAA
ncbi:MAG TPA: hypothetical protein VF290_18165 [Pyrinomonadaceae bacterium]